MTTEETCGGYRSLYGGSPMKLSAPLNILFLFKVAIAKYLEILSRHLDVYIQENVHDIKVILCNFATIQKGDEFSFSLLWPADGPVLSLWNWKPIKGYHGDNTVITGCTTDLTFVIKMAFIWITSSFQGDLTQGHIINNSAYQSGAYITEWLWSGFIWQLASGLTLCVLNWFWWNTKI